MSALDRVRQMAVTRYTHTDTSVVGARQRNPFFFRCRRLMETFTDFATSFSVRILSTSQLYNSSNNILTVMSSLRLDLKLAISPMSALFKLCI